ncbi:hypothetical protein HMF3257_34755 [Spirosoma telluris]|uniref:Uncharacterized protein n=1 Tax=Spirosoma telluris TaxID=2183553 RepID=A0A327NTD3_9BACT|nr:hypothetical protein HMF3257_34755 [Spirosoma telluris]
MDDKELAETYTSKIASDFYSPDNDQPGSPIISNELEHLKFQNLLAQYKAKVFERHACLFLS